MFWLNSWDAIDILSTPARTCSWRTHCRDRCCATFASPSAAQNSKTSSDPSEQA